MCNFRVILCKLSKNFPLNLGTRSLFLFLLIIRRYGLLHECRYINFDRAFRLSNWGYFEIEGVFYLIHTFSMFLRYLIRLAITIWAFNSGVDLEHLRLNPTMIIKMYLAFLFFSFIEFWVNLSLKFEVRA